MLRLYRNCISCLRSVKLQLFYKISSQEALLTACTVRVCRDAVCSVSVDKECDDVCPVFEFVFLDIV
jgi:hypothetical protein